LKGDGKLSAEILFVYDVPKKPSAPFRGSKTNKTAIHVEYLM